MSYEELLDQIIQITDTFIEWVESAYDAIAPIIEEIHRILEDAAIANHMSIDEFLDEINKQSSIDAQIQAIDDHKFVIDDDTSRWN